MRKSGNDAASAPAVRHSPALSPARSPPAPPSQELPGFTEEPLESEAKFVTTGFARNAVLVSAGLQLEGFGHTNEAVGLRLCCDTPTSTWRACRCSCLQGVAGEVVKAVQEVRLW